MRPVFGTSAAIPALSATEAFALWRQGALVIDVRERVEWDSRYVPGARHIPLGQLAAAAASVPTDRDLLLLCHSGTRSPCAVNLLQRAGFNRATNVLGGMLAWSRARLPVIR